MTVGNRYSTPCMATSPTTTTAIAPVAPEIIPGRPPNKAVISPIKNAEYKPMIGDTPATKAKAIASGTSAKATVIPERTSSLAVVVRDRKNWSILSNVETDADLASQVQKPQNGHPRPRGEVADSSRAFLLVNVGNCNYCRQMPLFQPFQLIRKRTSAPLTGNRGASDHKNQDK